MAEPELEAECRGCGDEAVYQVKDEDGCVYWCARGWKDPYPGAGPLPLDVAIAYCPFCGTELEEAVEIEALPEKKSWGAN